MRPRLCYRSTLYQRRLATQSRRLTSRSEAAIGNRSYRVNERIRAPQVRVIGPDGDQLGVMEIAEAREQAEEMGLDLIEIAPGSDPPVCRIMDWGKFRYEQQKKVKESQRKSKQVETKGMRLRPNIEDHDLQTKIRKAAKFLEKGNSVKFTVIFRGPPDPRQDVFATSRSSPPITGHPHRTLPLTCHQRTEVDRGD